MPPIASDDWAANFQRALRQLARQKGEQLAGQIAPILFTNLRFERPQRYARRHHDKPPDDYFNRVVALYEQWSGYLYQLQQEKSDGAWLPLYQKLTTWARYDLNRVPYGSWVGQAEDMAQEAVAVLMTARFPYDTDFDAWARVILRNTRAAAQKRSQFHRISWTSWEDQAEAVTATGLMGKMEETITMHQDLLRAIETMGHDGRQRLILLRYFEGLSYAEMSQIMEKSLSALYKLHFEAIEELQDSLLRK